MNYKLRYFFLYFLACVLIFFSVVSLNTLLEIIKTKSLDVSIDFTLKDLQILLGGISAYSFLMAFTFVPIHAKPSSTEFNYNTTNKELILNKIDSFVFNIKGSSQRRKKIVDNNKISYLTGSKLKDLVITNIEIEVLDNKIHVTGPCIYINQIKKLY